MTPEASAGSSTNARIWSRLSAALPAAANTIVPWLVAKLLTRLKALQSAAPAPPCRLRGTKPPSDIEMTSAPSRVATTIPSSTQEKNPLPFRSKQRLYGVSGRLFALSCAGVAARLRSTLMFRIFAWGATPISRPPPISDRKSTRLNSSHGYISYAVFCLKKKKQPPPAARLTAPHQRPPLLSG